MSQLYPNEFTIKLVDLFGGEHGPDFSNPKDIEYALETAAKNTPVPAQILAALKGEDYVIKDRRGPDHYDTVPAQENYNMVTSRLTSAARAVELLGEFEDHERARRKTANTQPSSKAVRKPVLPHSKNT